MKKYRLVIAYDGTRYHGWQQQEASKPTITSILQDTFAKVFDKKISIVGASRTDAGVHAMGQVALFKTDLQLSVEAMHMAWNNLLPADIVIRQLEEAPDNFHPFYNVVQKIYTYTIFLERPLPFMHRYGWHYYQSLDVDKLCKALQYFVGTHDFRSFCTGPVKNNDTIRTIEKIDCEIKMWHCVSSLPVLTVTVRGKRFLHHMIRRMVGAAIYVASHSDYDVNYIQQVLTEKNPRQILPNAPAKGLCLNEVIYEEKV